MDKENLPTAVAGVPPDGFSPTGQLWGNPLYRWEAHRETGYQWWITRLWYCFELYDVVRIDHFRAFHTYWCIPDGASDARGGHWEPGPGMELVEALRSVPGLALIAEDLGDLDADALRAHADEVKHLFAQNAALRSRAARYIASAGSLLLDSRRAEACSANFEKVRRYVKRLCARLLPRLPDGAEAGEELRLLSAITPKGPVFYRGTVQALADRYVVFHDDCGAVSRLLLELIRAEALARGYHIITCPCAMHPDDKIDHLFIPALRLAFLTDNRWHPVQLPGVQAVRCTRFVDRENLAGYRARLRFNERAAAELLEQAADLMAQAKACHDELETYYRAAVDFDRVDAAAVQCAEMLGLE